MIRDPEVQLLAALAEGLKSDYQTEEDLSWFGSEARRFRQSLRSLVPQLFQPCRLENQVLHAGTQVSSMTVCPAMGPKPGSLGVATFDYLGAPVHPRRGVQFALYLTAAVNFRPLRHLRSSRFAQSTAGVSWCSMVRRTTLWGM